MNDNINLPPDIIARLKTYGLLLETWQKKMNLISPATVPVMWKRHFEDSLQLLPYVDQVACQRPQPNVPLKLVDLGSGAGFPGLVLAIARPDTLAVTLIESDLKKCLFLENVSRETFSPVTVLGTRIESLPYSLKGDVITARGLASLSQILTYAFPLMNEGSIGLFLKGKDFEKEIEDAQKKWKFDLEIYPSLTDSGEEF